MKQVLQHLRTGQVEVADVPSPPVRPGHLLIQTTYSLISAGTERMLVEFAKGGLLAKARSQPDKVKQVLDKIKTDGLLPTLETVFSRLDEPLPLGYCNVGRVLEVGAGVSGFKPGDRVANNGGHARSSACQSTCAQRCRKRSLTNKPRSPCWRASALQGIRLLQPTLANVSWCLDLD